ncbi:hypothetical protein KGM_207717 [Danaus plexippus plexippus]|uniref:Uncharacterized protein n=1 Tax=Danaus plexippus plexippus TaxID=278856 RepID=A0A212FBM0_DANPL|nr:hypothetical protein KGM_207717 [Danaus plexippus plexippus]
MNGELSQTYQWAIVFDDVANKAVLGLYMTITPTVGYSFLSDWFRPTACANRTIY